MYICECVCIGIVKKRRRKKKDDGKDREFEICDVNVIWEQVGGA